MTSEFDFVPLVKWDCEHIDRKAMTCRKAEAGESVDGQKIRLCLDCLVALYHLTGKQNDDLRLPYITKPDIFFLRPRKA